MVRIRDTLVRDTVELIPREPGKVSFYVCGPTVYDEPHVGNARTAVVFDIIRRYLEWTGFDVTFVSNVTDVEDKIIARAAQQGITEPELAQRYEAVYFDLMDRLNVKRADHRPRATEYIQRMIDLVAQLVASGHAYAVEDQGVYFDVESFDRYGELSHRTLEELRESAGARVDVDEAKRSPMDFALWKAAKPGEPAWDSPWGKGRPGWHIECSAMSLDILGEGFDLHGGGNDLMFPHHENERAQAEGAGHPFARHWIHSGMVTIGDEKMAKSAGNFVTTTEALERFGAAAFRLAVLQTHYTRSMDLGPSELDAAAKGVERLNALVRRAAAAGVDVGGAAVDDAIVHKFRDAMDDDFNTPNAMAAVFDAAARANRAIDDGDLVGAASLVATVTELTSALGLEVGASVSGADDDAEIDDLVRQRDDARAAKDFATADALRDDLSARGIQIEDTPGGTIWHR
jgi:cysteinyl-tRNA synthetase